MSVRERESRVISLMIDLYCRNVHKQNEICTACNTLKEYALKRVEKCVWEDEKPVCGKCPIHCYKIDMREDIRQVMRYSGPRMTFLHPIIAIEHLIKSRKKPPTKEDLVKKRAMASQSSGNKTK